MNNTLSNYLVERIMLTEKTNPIKKTVVVYSGRFQPFHNGHYTTYQLLVKKFGKHNVYIGTTNVVEKSKSPFNFKEKVEIMTTMFDIPKSHIIQLKQPYRPVEILSKFDENSTAYITVVGEKDKNRLGGKYFRKYTDVPNEPYRDAGYVFISPTQPNPISGTAVRNGMSTGTEKEKQDFFKNVVYPKFNQKIFNLISGKLHESFEIEKETIEEWLLSAKDWIITEGSATSAALSDDGPLGFFPNMDVFSKISVDRAKNIGYDILDMIMTKDVEDFYVHPEYPFGPVRAVSFFPAGVIGQMTPNNQIDIYSNKAYSNWYTHVTRMASLVGYQLVATQMQRDKDRLDKKLSTTTAISAKNLDTENLNNKINESITLPVEVGDTLLMGKFKNHPVVVKTIGKDEHGMPTINGKKVVTFRFGKKGPNIFDNIVEFEEINTITEDLMNGFKNLRIPRGMMPQIESKDMKKYLDFIKRQGYLYKIKKIPVSNLNLTQGEINKDKIEKLMTTNRHQLEKPVIVSSCGYILDGHHRVLALYALDNNAKITVIQINLQIGKLLKISRNWDGVSFKHIHELTIINEATNKLKLIIPASVQKINKAFKKHGKKLYVVGGAVRDAILGKPQHDFDLTTDAKPHEIVDICEKEGLTHVDTDIIYGMIVVNGNEVVTFRKDIGGNRKLDGIDYTDIAGDVRRRDLTINALFYDIERKEIVDLVGGIKDLQDKRIRTVGVAADRFEEDHLRKLRAVRFTVKLGGIMDPDTLLAIKKDPTLKDVSDNRIRMEFMKSVESAKSTKIYLDLMEKLKFLPLTFPGLKITKPYIDENDYIVLMAYLLNKNSKSTLETKLNSLKYEKPEIIDITFLQSLDKFKPEEIVEYKKQQKRTHLTDAQILAYGKHTNKDYSKFVKFNTSVKGGDVPKDVKGKAVGDWISREEKRRFLNEMSKPELKSAEVVIDKMLNPIDVEFTKHFFQRVNNERNVEEITSAELIGFFRRLYKHKKQFIEFLKQYKQVVVKDNKSKINIPFVQNANKLIAKTVMRTSDWRKSSTPEFQFESNTPTSTQFKRGLVELRNAIEKGTHGLDKSDAIKLLYQNAMKMGISNKLIDNKTRLALNRHNKNFSSLNTPTKDTAIQGIDLVLKTLAENINEEQLNELAWESKTVDMCIAGQIPITSKLMNQIFGKVQINTLHITDSYGLDKLAKLQGTKKSLSTFTAASTQSNIAVGIGIRTSGGIIVAMKGDLLVASVNDIMSRPDPHGRRWVSPYFLWGYLESSSITNGFPTVIANNKKLSDFAEKYGAIDKWQGDFHRIDQGKLKVTNNEINDFIRLYMKEAEKFALAHKDEIINRNVGLQNRAPDGWNEVLVNNIKIEEIMVMDWKVDERAAYQIKKKYKNVTIGYDVTDIPKFVNKYGKFITENTISNKQPLSELDFIPDLAKKTKVWYTFSPLDIMKVSDNIIDLVQTAYSKTSNGSFVNNKSDINRSDFWNAITLDNEPDADVVIFGRNTKQGIKLQGIGHDGNEISKEEVVKHLGRQLKKQGFWVEASEALERVLYKVGIPYVTSEKVVQSIFPNSDLKMTGNKGQYTRKLKNGKVITETIFGNPKVSVRENINEVKQPHKITIFDVAEKHQMNPDDLKFELQNGFKVEREHGNTTKVAEENTINNLFTDTNFYSKLSKGNINEAKERPTITFLIGPPASGKSTWVSKHGSGKVIISRDDIAERVARLHKISYNDLFNGKHDALQNKINSELQSHINSSIKSGKDIIVDMTNVTKKSRNGILSRLPITYIKNAVVFNVSRPELLKRLQQREKETGKKIPTEVLDDMLSRFEKPTTDEFDNIKNEGYVLQNLEKVYDIELELWDTGKILQLDKIIVPKTDRISGKGTKVMNIIINLADKQKKPIYLTPSTSFGATSVSRLTQFYKQFGFVPNKDVSISKASMVRYPSTNESINEEMKDYPVNNQIKTFKDLFSKLPAELQKRIFGLKSIAQNPKWHPEGNVLKHTIMVVNRALKTAPGDIDLALAAMFHDVGKDATGGIHPKTGQVTHYGHELTSAQLVKKYDNVIKSLGGNVEDVFYIVNNHMRMKNYDIMRISKQRELNSHQSFAKLQHFSSKMDKGGLKDNVNEFDSIDKLVNDMDTQLESFVFQDKNKEVLKEGGAYGHMNHPFDIEINLTFGQLKDIVSKALDGNLEVTKEKCISGDSILNTETHGDMTIAEFVDTNINDKVLSYNEETNKTEYMNVIGKFNNDIDDDWLEIELKDGKTILVTPNHKIYVEGIGYIRADELTEEMELKII